MSDSVLNFFKLICLAAVVSACGLDETIVGNPFNPHSDQLSEVPDNQGVSVSLILSKTQINDGNLAVQPFFCADKVVIEDSQGKRFEVPLQMTLMTRRDKAVKIKDLTLPTGTYSKIEVHTVTKCYAETEIPVSAGSLVHDKANNTSEVRYTRTPLVAVFSIERNVTSSGGELVINTRKLEDFLWFAETEDEITTVLTQTTL